MGGLVKKGPSKKLSKKDKARLADEAKARQHPRRAFGQR
jgi:hypothetical protein